MFCGHHKGARCKARSQAAVHRWSVTSSREASWRRLVGKSAVLPAVLASVAWLVSCVGGAWRESDVAYVERQLSREGLVPAIQEWLVQHPEGPVRDAQLRNVMEWPACMRELRPLRVFAAENGGVCLVLSRGVSVRVYPSGKRPGEGRSNGLIAFGGDAYISTGERRGCRKADGRLSPAADE